MAEAIYDALGQVLTRWTMGLPAAPSAPFWKAELGEEPVEAELRLLALSGQFLGMAVIAEPPTELRELPDLPALALPAMPATLRPLARRVLAAGDARHKRDLAHFVAARGWTLHPADWMPAANDDDAPDVYAPWRAWAQAAAATVERRASGGLTAANWEDFWPAARKAALAELRGRDPAAARAVLEARFADEGADARLRMLAVTGQGLSEADVPFLEGIAAADRAPKVKALAISLLARLGRGSAVGEDVIELAGFFAVGAKGLLRRTRTVTAQAIKTSAQRNRRQALFENADYSAFAAALGLSADELTAAWPWRDDADADWGVANMAGRSASDAIVAAIAEAQADYGSGNLQLLHQLTPRLTPVQCSAITGQLLRRGRSYREALAVAGGGVNIDAVNNVPAEAAMIRALGVADARPGDIAPEMQALGMLASRAAAQRAYEGLVRSAGLLQADPRLDMIRLNAALEQRGV